MMKANELRIGNLFIPTDGSVGYNHVTADDLKAWSLGAVYGKAIPLTPDILENCGFFRTEKTNKNFEWGVTNTTVYYHTYLPRMNSLIIRIQDDKFVWENSLGGYIQYLHQLQNLFFTLTGEELIYNYSGYVFKDGDITFEKPLP